MSYRDLKMVLCLVWFMYNHGKYRNKKYKLRDEIHLQTLISCARSFKSNPPNSSQGPHIDYINVVVTLFSNIIHEQNTSNTNLTNKAYPGYCKHVLCWRPPKKSLSLSSWWQQNNVKHGRQRDCPAQGRTDGTISPSDVYIVLSYFLSSDC